MQQIKVYDLIETKEGNYVYILDILDDLNFMAIDFETNNKNSFLTTFDIKRVVKLPNNVQPLWIKKVEKIMKGF